MLHERSGTYQRLKDNKEDLYAHEYKTEREYKQFYPFLKEVDSKALQSSTRNLLVAFKNFFDGLKKKRKVGYPKFKSRKNKQSYTTYNINNNMKIDFETRLVKFPKIKTWIKYRDDRAFGEPIKHITVSRTKSGKYYVSILVERDLYISMKRVISREKIQAFDMSFPKFLVSTRNEFESPRFYRKEEEKLQKLHRGVSRKKKGSNNRNKARVRLARKYERIYNRKNDWTHKISHELSNEFDVVILEDINIEGMKQLGKGHAKSVTLDFSWHQFVSMLRYKLEQRGKYLILVDRWFPSSKLCSGCGWKNTELKLSDRVWECQECHAIHDRDKNAARNLFNEGVKQLNSLGIMIKSTVGTTGSHAREDDISRVNTNAVINEPRISRL
jgi:putative transposase